MFLTACYLALYTFMLLFMGHGMLLPRVRYAIISILAPPHSSVPIKSSLYYHISSFY